MASAISFPPSAPILLENGLSCLPRETTESKKRKRANSQKKVGEQGSLRKDSQKEVAANRNGRLIAYLGHRRVLLQQLCHDKRPAIHVKALSAVVQGVHCVLAKLIGMDCDVLVLVLAAENNGAQCLVGLQGLRNRLSTLWTQVVPGSMELLYCGVCLEAFGESSWTFRSGESFLTVSTLMLFVPCPIIAADLVLREVQDNQRLVRLQHLSESLGAGGSETI